MSLSSRLVQLLRSAPLAPPFVLLEDGSDRGAVHLAWGARERLRLDRDAVGRLGAFDPGNGWIGAIGYDLGLPPKAARRVPSLAQPVVDLFRPLNRIEYRAGREPILVGPDAQRVWREAGRGRRRGAEAGPIGATDAVGTAGALGATMGPAGAPRTPPEAARSFTQPEFEAAVVRALEYIRAGDIYQVNLSVAETVALRDHSLDVYARLRRFNPSPWMGYADFGDWQLVSGSPELLVEVADGRARAKPIAGTRKKTGDAAGDEAMRRELLTDPKEAAEHVMLVDLARNDLGRVARYGGVRVAERAIVEAYSHVMHLVSDVRAELRPECRAWDVFRAMFPGGTITGTPKIRSMEIIAELEPVARGMYTGALGWWEGDRGQWNILIRSAVVRGTRAVLQAGAGIVADSIPAREWKESLRKAAALRVAFGVGA